MRQKAELPSPQNSTQTQTPRESKFALLSLLTSSHCVKLWVSDTHWQAARHDGSGGHWRPVESAWLLHSERKGTIVDTPMVKHMVRLKRRRQQSQEIRKEQTGTKESQAFKHHTNQFYHCTALLSGPKHELEVVYLEWRTLAVPPISLCCT